VQILLIRWIGTEVRVFAYFQNLALVACFVGFGLGCYWAERRRSLLVSLAAMAVVAALVSIPGAGWAKFLEAVSTRLAMSPDAAIWGFVRPDEPASAWLLTAASILVVAGFLLLLIAVMIPLGQSVGYYLGHSENVLRDYTVNLVGSVIGLWIMSVLAFRWLPPVSWFALAGLLILIARRPALDRVTGTAAAVVLVTFVYPLFTTTVLNSNEKLAKGATQEFWSPYQKLRLFAAGDDEYGIAVNNTGYMTVHNVNPDFLQRHPQNAAAYKQSSYDAPFKFVERRDDVLVVGGGAGNDVAAALRNGAAHVDVAEIDPLILALGERVNPGQPYSSPKVTKAVNDARNFMRTTKRKYDVIVFGLLDSHTLLSPGADPAFTNTRSTPAVACHAMVDGESRRTVMVTPARLADLRAASGRGDLATDRNRSLRHVSRIPGQVCSRNPSTRSQPDSRGSRRSIGKLPIVGDELSQSDGQWHRSGPEHHLCERGLCERDERCRDGTAAYASAVASVTSFQIRNRLLRSRRNQQRTAGDVGGRKCEPMIPWTSTERCACAADLKRRMRRSRSRVGRCEF
jgi:hypothetical protein